MINWKWFTKYYRTQFLLWVSAYNELADKYMIDESYSSGPPSFVVVYKEW